MSPTLRRIDLPGGITCGTFLPVSRLMAAGAEELALVEADARARIGHHDERDWPGLAAALLMNCPIWTEDQDFFGTGVSTWTTTTVAIYLKS
jgi:hypothetical protein